MKRPLPRRTVDAFFIGVQPVVLVPGQMPAGVVPGDADAVVEEHRREVLLVVDGESRVGDSAVDAAAVFEVADLVLPSMELPLGGMVCAALDGEGAVTHLFHIVDA